VLEYSFAGLPWAEIIIKLKTDKIMRYAWVSFAIVALWISSIILIMSDKLVNPNNFYIFLVLTTVIVSYVGFKSAA
jgi:hypothetical protein